MNVWVSDDENHWVTDQVIKSYLLLLGPFVRPSAAPIRKRRPSTISLIGKEILNSFRCQYCKLINPNNLFILKLNNV